MDEDEVKQHIERWAKSESGVSDVLPEQTVIPGGLKTDFVVKNNQGGIIYLIECKGSQGQGELAKGIGQAQQYDFQKRKNPQAASAKAILAVPEDTVAELENLYVPREVSVMLVTDKGSVMPWTRHPMSKSSQMELQISKTFYVRDIEFGHIKGILEVIDQMATSTAGPLDERSLRRQIRAKFPGIAASGYNHLITIRKLGLMDEEHRLTSSGYATLRMVQKKKLAPFNRTMVELFYPFLINVMNAMVLFARQKKQLLSDLKFSDKDLAETINSAWRRKVRFMNDPRTVGTVIRMLRELGVVTFHGPKHYELNKLVHSEFLP